MILINLLPWREQEREAEKRNFFTLLGLSLFGVVFIVAIAYLILNGQVRGQTAANDYLKKQIVGLDQKIAQINQLKKKKADLIERMNLIQNLQYERKSTVHLFEDMVRVVPKGIYLTQVQRTGDIVLLTGKAESNSRVSELMRNIRDKSEWLVNPILTEIKTNEEDDDSLARDFQLEMEIVSVAKPDKSEQTAKVV